ncbi:MAG: hypothetical protein IT371_15155 [Deltaproteobacteria bacterium]|nr:hypothetical protein [Deltaproteobacteria bacterium]
MSKVSGLLYLPLAAGLVLSGCSSNGGTTTADGGTTKTDGSTTKTDSSTPPPTEIKCNNDCKDLVLNRILLPSSPTEAQKFAVDFNNDGTKDNALGSILSALSAVAKDLTLQASIDHNVNQGKALILLRLQAKDFANAPSAAAQAWLGKQTACCTSTAAGEESKCADEAAKTCFAGSGEFEIDPTAPKDALFGGSITSGAIKFGPAKLNISLPITDAGTLTVSLQKAQFMGKFDGSKITEGVLAGGVTKADLDNNVIPTVATLLDKTAKDPKTSATTKNQILNLFDANKDGTITKDEVAKNDLIKTFLAGDVDVDGDGTPELSLGIGFSAVLAKIK